MTLNVLAIAVGGVAASSIYFVLTTMPSWNSSSFWADWEENLRWDWWVRERILLAVLCAPLGMLLSAVFLKLATRLLRRPPDVAAKGPPVPGGGSIS
jgi:hypothetical protein